MEYLFLIILLLVLIYLYDYKRFERNKSFWLIFVTIYLIILGGLHYRLGFDNITYEKFYAQVNPINKLGLIDFRETRFSPGFVILSSISKSLSSEIVLFNFIQSGFVCGVITWFFNKNSRNPFFALFLFFMFMYTLLIFEQIREAISAAIFLLAWSSFVKHRWLTWYFLSFLAIMFHTSAVILLVLPIITIPGIKQFFILGKRTIFICILIFVLGMFLQVKFSKYIDLLAITDATEELTAKYKDTNYIKSNLNFLGYFGYLFKDAIYPLLALFCLYPLKYENNRFINIVPFALISVYISIFSLFIPIFSRFNNYFFFFSILVLSNWVFSIIRIKNRKIRFNYLYWIVLFIPLFIAQTYSSYLVNKNKSGTLKRYMAYYPYTSYLNKEKDENREKLFKYEKHHVFK